MAQVHFLRGNLLFPRGDLEGCLQEHSMSLQWAREARSAELEAAALGGLGDAEYLSGRMLSAHERFRDCVALSLRHGFGRIEVANRPLVSFTRWFAGDTRGALADAEEAIAVARRVGHQRAEMVGHTVAWHCRHSLMNFDAAREHAEAALALSRQLGARRFEAEALACQAELHRLVGRREEAVAAAQEAVAALETFARRQPSPWSNFVIARGRALAAFGRGARSVGMNDELSRLRENGERLGLLVALPAIEAALTVS